MLEHRQARVAVFDAGYPSTLALVQSLAQAGAPLIVFHHEKRHALRFSRYVRQVHACPDVFDYRQFPDWLEQQFDSGIFDVIAPTSDVVCYHLANLLHRMPARYRQRLPSRDAFLDVLFKDRLAAACERHGIATPATRAPTGLDQALADAEVVGYPLLLKPRTHICNTEERGVRVDDAEQLRAAFSPYTVSHRQQSLLSAHPELVWPLLQQYLAHDSPQLSGSGLLGADSHLIAGAATVKCDQSPSVTGVGTAFASHDCDDFVQDCARSVARLLERGLFEIEMLSHTPGEPRMVIDVNARVFGQVGFDMARGNDLPALWYASLGQDLPRRPRPRHDVVCLYPGPFLLSNLTRIVTGPRRWQRLRWACRLLWRTRSCIGWNRRDPIASIVMLLRPLRHPTTFIRSHVRERRDVTVSN